MSDWHEDDRLWEAAAPYLFTRERMELARRQVDALAELMELAPRSSVLDMCCGVGRHALELARRGFVVTGVDRTRSYLERAREQAASERLKVEFVEADARVFVRPGAFDAAINMFSSFGYFDDPADDFKLLQNLHASLKPAGRFAIDLLGKEILARAFRERDWSETEDGALLLEERKATSGWGRVETRWIAIGGGERREFSLSLRLYSGAEITSLLKLAGFAQVKLYGNLDGAPYDHHAERLVAVAER